jgi:hypothetical protein
METMILVFQILCVALLAMGTGFSMFHLMQQSTQGGRMADRFSYSVANDFETDFRRVARGRR